MCFLYFFCESLAWICLKWNAFCCPVQGLVSTRTNQCYIKGRTRLFLVELLQGTFSCKSFPITFLHFEILILWCSLKFTSRDMKTFRFLTYFFGWISLLFVLYSLISIDGFLYFRSLNLSLLKSNLIGYKLSLNMLKSFGFDINFIIFIYSAKVSFPIVLYRIVCPSHTNFRFFCKSWCLSSISAIVIMKSFEAMWQCYLWN